MILLAIESSCDETACAAMNAQGEVLGSTIHTQIDIHAVYGGVVPEIASRKHMEALPAVVAQTLDQAGLALQAVDAFAVTYGPGLSGALLCGVNYAKGLAYAMDKPLLGVHHIEGHMMANHVTHRELQPPYICLICSGGHTMLVHVQDYGRYRLLGQTRDDAAGEAFDKVARALGLGYPGGPKLEKLAREGDPSAYRFTRPRCENPYDFSFSGLKTAVINLLHHAAQTGASVDRAAVAASFQIHTIEFLLHNAIRACQETGVKAFSMVGGVCANEALRQEAQKRGEKQGIRVFLPDKGLCTDNAVMIAEAARWRLLNGETSEFTLNAVPTLPLSGLQ